MTAADKYKLNDMLSFIGRFWTRDPLNPTVKIYTDPTEVECRVKDPSNTETTYIYGTDAEITRLEEGVYIIDVQGTIAGTWRFIWDGDGDVESSDDDYCIVQALPF